MALSTFRNQRVKLRFSRAYGNSSPLAVPVERNRQGFKVTRKGVFVFLKVMMALVGTAGLAWGSHHVCKNYIWGGDRFTVKEIRVATDGELTRPEILARAGLKEGVRIFDVNLSEARKGLEEVSQVETVEVERFLPSTVVVRLTERKPVAWILEGAETDPSKASRAYVVDAKGWVMPQRKVSMQLRYLPVINGAHDLFDNLAPGQRAGGYEIQAAIRLLTSSEAIARFRPRVIDLSKGFCMEVTDLTRTKYTFGFERMDEQLGRMQQVMSHTEHSGKEVASVNLMYAKQIPVVFGGPISAAKAEDRSEKVSKSSVTAPAVADVSSSGQKSATAVRGASVQSAPVPTTRPTLPANPIASAGGTWGGASGLAGSKAISATRAGGNVPAASVQTPKKAVAEAIPQKLGNQKVAQTAGAGGNGSKVVTKEVTRTVPATRNVTTPSSVVPKATAVPVSLKKDSGGDGGSSRGGVVPTKTGLQVPSEGIRKLFNRNG